MSCTKSTWAGYRTLGDEIQDESERRLLAKTQLAPNCEQLVELALEYAFNIAEHMKPGGSRSYVGIAT